MADKMDAVVCHGSEDYRFEKCDVPVRKPGELLIRVEAVGICASDVKCFHGAVKFWGDDNRPAYVETPVIAGHEFAGEVVDLDDEARSRWSVEIGDRVVSEQIVPCWQCRYCLRGQYWMCARHDIYGFRQRTPGAMATFMAFPTGALVHKVSKDIPATHAAFAEPLSCSLHAVERAGICFDDVVVVAGCGPIGLGMIAGAAAKGPRHVIALDMSDAKLELAALCGADFTVNIADTDPTELVNSLTEGYGADVYLEGTGHPSAVGQGLALLRKLGTYVEYSVFKDPVSIDWSIISDDKELDVLGAHLGPHCWPAAIAMIESGRLPLDRICSHQLPLEKYHEGLAFVDDGTTSVKVSLIPS